MSDASDTRPADLPSTIAVIGAGTMGAGIAQLAAQTGARTLLHDPIPEALERGIASIGAGLDKLVSREKITAEDAEAIKARIEPAATLEELASATFVIEAAPERMELKLDLFSKLDAILAPEAVLATNTSSLSVTEIAAGVGGDRASRVVGFHFFNPAPVMKLVEVVAGQASAAQALAIAHAVGEAMGKTTIDAADVAGFLVNRCNRPYSLEALRLLQERVATVEQIDRITRLGGAFRMGPFELMDLVGIETNHAVAESFYRASYGEPRYQPSPIQARMIASGRLGRKTGSGWYDYCNGTKDFRPADPDPLILGGGDGRLIVIIGTLPIAAELRRSATRDGWDVRDAPDPDGAEPWLTVDCAGAAISPGLPDHHWHGPRARLLYDGSLAVTDPTAVGFHFLPPFRECKLAELTGTPSTPLLAIERAEEFFASVGCHCEHVSDAPGLALGRIVAQLINEAAFLIGEGNGSPEDVDAGMRLGVNHPRGPVEWSAMIGLEHIVSILDALHREHGEPRYRVAPLLRQRAALGATGLADLLDS